MSARSRSREFWSFFGGSAVGLAIDLVGFQLLLWLGLQPWLANLVSSAASITAVYVLVSRYSFGASARMRTYLLFVGWYATSIVLFSSVIQLAATETGWHAMLWKLLTVPVSFALNYLFSRYVFLPRARA